MNGSSASSRRWRSTTAERAQWAQRFFQSGLSQREFASRHGLRLCTLQRWIGQHRVQGRELGPAVTPAFAELKLPALTNSPRWVAEVRRSDGTTVRLAPEVSGRLLRQLLRAC